MDGLIDREAAGPPFMKVCMVASMGPFDRSYRWARCFRPTIFRTVQIASFSVARLSLQMS
jgi:hypothetical protein